MKMMKRNKHEQHDDGRTIADMSRLDNDRSFLNLVKNKKKDNPNQSEVSENRPWEVNKFDIPKEEKKAYILFSILAALGIGLIYIVIFGILIFLFIKLIG